jgi:enoyl-CoA hydratase/carnithine racemase
MSQASYRQDGEIAVITMENPPVNGLGFDLRTGIDACVRRAMADASIKAVVLTGTARAFSGGADIREFNSPKSTASPNLMELITLIEGADKPVIAAVGGLALGGGNELALGCHYRVCAPGTMIGLPEVNLGLLPGAGGTQRLPRVVGAAKALDVIQKLMPEVNEWADKAAKQLYFASYVAPSPTAGACAEIAAGQLPGTPATVSFWLALGSDDLGALDILMDVLAEVAGRPGLSDITSETIRSTLPRLFAQLPAVAALHGRNDEYMASLAGEAVKFILRRVAEEAELESRGATTPAAEGPDASTDRA